MEELEAEMEEEEELEAEMEEEEEEELEVIAHFHLNTANVRGHFQRRPVMWRRIVLAWIWSQND